MARWRARFAPPEFSEPYLDVMLRALTEMNLMFLRERPHTPGIYESGVRYSREQKGIDDWSTIPYILESGHGDCEDLSAWRAAELQKLGERASAFAKLVRVYPDGSRLFHIRVRRGNGQIEDPSRLLGMGEQQHG